MTLEFVSVREIRARFAAGTLSPRAYAEVLATRADARAELALWAHFDADAFVAAAEAAPAAGALAGLPVAVKDIFDTADMPTEAGSPLWAGRRPARDAACVASLRAAGGVVMGKTVTTEFAYACPGPTRNPHDPNHTPGGSSSGSAAAVAAGIAPLAIGSQTAGSIVRPAAFCGVVGLKPTFGRISRAGVLSFSESLDTVGTFARSVADAWLLAEVLAGVAEPADAPPPAAPPRLGLCRTDDWDRATPDAQAALLSAAEACRRAGATVVEVRGPQADADLQATHLAIMASEAAHALAPEWRTGRDGLSPQLAALLEEGRAIDMALRRRHLETAAAARADWSRRTAGLDAVLTPSAVGEAPAGLGGTGDPVFNRVWTLLGGPCVALPFGRGAAGLPLGVQLVGRPWEDETVVAAAAFVERALRSAQGA
jgi:amidase